MTFETPPPKSLGWCVLQACLEAGGGSLEGDGGLAGGVGSLSLFNRSRALGEGGGVQSAGGERGRESEKVGERKV